MHIPVLLSEVVENLRPQGGQNFIDGTFGGGGHASAILEKNKPDGQLWAFDQDISAVRRAEKLERVHAIHDSFGSMANAKYGLHEIRISGILLDLGFSSLQLDDSTRGLSFQESGPLDMRLNQDNDMTAEIIVNSWKEEELARLFKDYGEERFARRIAREIVSARKLSALETTDQLVSVIKKAVPAGGKIHPATRVFQALRIAVNDELNELRRGITGGLSLLQTGGRMAVISFHSLEDRIVKNMFKEAARKCVCPSTAWVCSCEKTQRFQIITKKPITPGTDEISQNPRSRSAKLRVIERI
jgi:16S rRNA (cytosine1402-N4)-methyltransferase